MKKTLLQNSAFLVPYLLFLFTAMAFLLMHTKGEAHLIINQHRSEFCDYFFSLVTYLGDGVTAIIVIILACFIKYRYAVFLAVSSIFSALITQTLKHTLFSDQV